MKAEYSALDVINFDGELTDLKFADSNNLAISFHVNRNTGTKKLEGVRIKWVYTLHQNERLIFNYIAHDDFLVENPEAMNHSQAKRMLNESFTRLRDEYDFRTETLHAPPLSFSIPKDQQEGVLANFLFIFQ